ADLPGLPDAVRVGQRVVRHPGTVGGLGVGLVRQGAVGVVGAVVVVVPHVLPRHRPVQLVLVGLGEHVVVGAQVVGQRPVAHHAVAQVVVEQVTHVGEPQRVPVDDVGEDGVVGYAIGGEHVPDARHLRVGPGAG